MRGGSAGGTLVLAAASGRALLGLYRSAHEKLLARPPSRDYLVNIFLWSPAGQGRVEGHWEYLKRNQLLALDPALKPKRDGLKFKQAKISSALENPTAKLSEEQASFADIAGHPKGRRA